MQFFFFFFKNSKGNNFASKKDFKNAVHWYTEALKLNNDDFLGVIAKQCRCYLQLKNWKELLDVAEHCLQLNSTDVDG
jgi:tetratricopeptide (TPR) repeat protein